MQVSNTPARTGNQRDRRPGRPRRRTTRLRQACRRRMAPAGKANAPTGHGIEVAGAPRIAEAGAMQIVKLCWVGTRTDAAEPMVAFVRDVLGMRPEPLGTDFWLATLPDGGKVEIFGPRSAHNR